MFLYFPVKQQLYQEDLGNYVTYGIAAWRIFSLHPSPCAFISDVTPDRRAVVHLCWQCTVGQLYPRQLKDVIEDFIL